MDAALQAYYNGLCCGGSPACNAVVNSTKEEQQSNDVLLSWIATGAVSYDVFIDSVFTANVNSTSYVVAGGADGLAHTYNIVPKCVTGVGTAKGGNYIFNPPCKAVMLVLKASQSGNNVVLNWTADNAISYDIVVDGVTIVTAIVGNQYTIAGGADDNDHTYSIIPNCKWGTGMPKGGNFNFSNTPAGCGATITNVQINRVAAGDILFTWSSTGAIKFDFYVDGVYRGTTTINEFHFLSEHDKENHDFKIVPYCSATSTGTPYEGTYGFDDGCNAGITSVAADIVGEAVRVSWVPSGAAADFEIYVDGDVSPYGATTDLYYDLPYSFADGQTHSFYVRAKCAFIGGGTGMAGTFQFVL